MKLEIFSYSPDKRGDLLARKRSVPSSTSGTNFWSPEP